jgi:hypothetical protein
LALRYARRTLRLTATVGRLAIALAGRAGAAVLAGLGVPLSRSTLLRALAIHSDLVGACAGTEKGAPDLGECGCRSQHSAVIEEHLSGG